MFPRRVAWLLVLTTMTLVLAACGGAPPSTAPTEAGNAAADDAAVPVADGGCPTATIADRMGLGLRPPAMSWGVLLLEALPQLGNLGEPLQAIGGDIPGPLERPGGCPFHTRCRELMAGRCDTEVPAATQLGPGNWVRCLLFE